MAMTGFFYNFKRPRVATPMGMLKYDPIGAFTRPLVSLAPAMAMCPPRARSNSNLVPVRKKVLFLESKKRVR